MQQVVPAHSYCIKESASGDCSKCSDLSVTDVLGIDTQGEKCSNELVVATKSIVMSDKFLTFANMIAEDCSDLCPSCNPDCAK